MPQRDTGGQPADLALHRAEIDQATGMLTESSASASLMHSSGCVPMLMHVTFG